MASLALTAWSHRAARSGPMPIPCCMSRTSASKPALAISSAIYVSAQKSQATVGAFPCCHSAFTLLMRTLSSLMIVLKKSLSTPPYNYPRLDEVGEIHELPYRGYPHPPVADHQEVSWTSFSALCLMSRTTETTPPVPCCTSCIYGCQYTLNST